MEKIRKVVLVKFCKIIETKRIERKLCLKNTIITNLFHGHYYIPEVIIIAPSPFAAFEGKVFSVCNKWIYESV